MAGTTDPLFWTVMAILVLTICALTYDGIHHKN